MSNKTLSAKQLIRHERISITALVMGVMLLFILGVGLLVPWINSNNIYNSAHKMLDSVVTNAIQAAYGYGSVDNINPNQSEDIFVVFIDEDGLQWSTGKSDSNEIQFKTLFIADKGKSGKQDFSKDGWIYSIYDADYLQNSLLPKPSVNEDDSITVVSIHVAEEAIFYAGIDRTSEINSLNTMTLTLILVLVSSFLIMIPVIYFISNRVIKPTKDNLKHEKDFIANASHELKTPLAIITAETEVLRERHPEETTYFNQIVNQCQNMNETVLDMIALSKLETSKDILETVDYSQLLLQLCLSFDAMAFERGIQYSYDIDEGIVLEKAFRKNVSRLTNLLIDNAMKYTEGEKIIYVSLKKEKRGGVLTVYNTGCQVRDEDREKVFDRFYQGKSGSDDERKGSGLGLAIVKSICVKYNYQVSIESHYMKDMKFTVVMK